MQEPRTKDDRGFTDAADTDSVTDEAALTEQARLLESTDRPRTHFRRSEDGVLAAAVRELRTRRSARDGR